MSSSCFHSDRSIFKTSKDPEASERQPRSLPSRGGNPSGQNQDVPDCSGEVPSATKKYRYRPLPGDDYMRVLELQPGTGPISCKLLSKKVKRVAGTYQAISYVWGDKSKTSSILCDGRILPITQSLHDALHRIRNRRKPRRLWADAVCINQKDQQEQGHQVKKMGRIYENAKRVLIWIGKDDGTAEDCFKTIKEFNQYFATRTSRDGIFLDVPLVSGDGSRIPTDSAQWDAVRAMLGHAWFKRAWVLQEVGLAASAVLLYGNRSMDWCEIVKFMLMRLRRADIQSITGPLRTCALTSAYFDLWNAYDNAKSWRNELTTVSQSYRKTEPTFIDALYTGRMFEATDPKDRVYAFLGHPHARRPDGSQIIEVDYTKSVDDVYFETARALIENGPHPWYVLAMVDPPSSSESLHGDRLSWVPRWDEGWRVDKIGFPDYWYRAGGQGMNEWKAAVQKDKSLVVRGLIFDDIVCKSGVLKFNDFDLITGSRRKENRTVASVDLLWDELARWGYGSYYQNQQDREDAFSLCLVIGRETYGFDAAEDAIMEHRRRFAAYRDAIQRQARGSPHDETLAKEQSRDAFDFQAFLHVQNRRFFCTKDGYYGLGHGELKTGDVCCIFSGANVPFILRRSSQGPNCYKLVGECYIHGVMKGQVLERLKDGDFQEKDIVLV